MEQEALLEGIVFDFPMIRKAFAKHDSREWAHWGMEGRVDNSGVPVSCTMGYLVFLDPAPTEAERPQGTDPREPNTGICYDPRVAPRGLSPSYYGSAPLHPGSVAACLTVGSPS
jgi:hypothetical protein